MPRGPSVCEAGDPAPPFHTRGVWGSLSHKAHCCGAGSLDAKPGPPGFTLSSACHTYASSTKEASFPPLLGLGPCSFADVLTGNDGAVMGPMLPGSEGLRHRWP